MNVKFKTSYMLKKKYTTITYINNNKKKKIKIITNRQNFLLIKKI
jgi:hypothetical protein